VESFGVKSARMALLGGMLAFLLAFLPHAFAFSNGQAASLVLGQSSFITSNTVATQTEENLPNALAFDSSGNMWIADTNNNRVLEYKAPFSTHEAASLVIGQLSFTSSNTATTAAGLNGVKTLAFDSGGNLWVVDFRQSRVLEYTAPLSTHEAASLVIGQTSFTTRECAFTSTCAANSTNLFDPNALAFDSGGNLWVADGDNNRVLEYGAPFSTHEAANLVIGQSGFTGHAATTTSTGLSAPEGVAFDSGHNLWVADYANSRVLQFGGGAASTTTSTTPEFPALAVPIVFTLVLAAALLLAPGRRSRLP
jgi:sugar lactone lactonase YvrE